MDPAVQYLVGKLKKELISHGGTGYHALQRKFRIMDDDGSKTISYGEFKKALHELGLGSLIPSEQRAVFEYFDVNENGTIEFEEFIHGVRDPLTQHRLNLVQQAFRRLDLDASGVVDIDEIKLLYDVSKHPDFTEGKKTQAEILRNFMESFEGGSKTAGDGQITMDEFINYYTNLGVSIDNDEYFELMMRNCWHISGGEGAAANSANKRVLVTHADGSQEVVEIKNDLGLAEGDNKSLLRRLEQQGVQASQVTTSAGIDLMQSGKASNTAKQLFLAKLKEEENAKVHAPLSPNSASKSRKAGKKSNAFSSSIGGLLNCNEGPTVHTMPPPPPAARSQIFDGQSDSPKARLSYRSSDMPHGVTMLVKKMKTALRSHGARGFHGLQRKFRIMDDNNDGKLSLGEFRKGIEELGLDVTGSDVRLMFNHFDYHNYSMIDFDDFIGTLRDELNTRRLELVRQAFSILDTDGNGILDANELMEKYDASQHPDVLSGKSTEEDILREWVTVFEVGGEIDGKVTWSEFVNYYTNLGASIDDDDYFELMIRNAWHISGGKGQAENSANTRVLVTKDDGTQQVVEVQKDLGTRGNKDALLSSVKKQDAHASTFNLFGGGGSDDRFEKPPSTPEKIGLAGRRYVAPRVDAHRATISSVGSMAVLAGVSAPEIPEPLSLPQQDIPLPPPAGSPTSKKPISLSVLAANQARGVPEIIASIKASLAERGARGIVGLSRKFRIIDDNGDGGISKTEFKKTLAEMNIKVSDDEVGHLFRFFDKDHSGDIDFEEFLRGVRGPLNSRREAVVRLAFNKLDTNGDGTLAPDEIMKIYDASKHPDVKAGKRTENEILREFLETFEVGGQIDGKVTWGEFLNYYANLGVSIDRDDYFELMMRNCWRISGGEGLAANTANRRVLVTDENGSQSIVELQNDTANGMTNAQALADVRAQSARNARASTIMFSDSIDTTKNVVSLKQGRKVTDQSKDSPFNSGGGVFDTHQMGQGARSNATRRQNNNSHNASTITFY